MSFETLSLLLVASLGSLGEPQVTEIIDGTGAGGEELAFPVALAVDRLGNAYVAGGFITLGNAFRISPLGEITEIISSNGDGLGNPLHEAKDIAVGRNGLVYVVGLFSHNAFAVSPGGGAVEIIDETGDGIHPLTNASAIAVDDFGNAYVAGSGSRNVFKIAPDGVITRILDESGDGAGHPLSIPGKIAVDRVGNVYVSHGIPFGDAGVFQISPRGRVIEIIDGDGDGLGHSLGLPWGVTVDADGSLYVAGVLSSNVFKITDPGGANEITQIIDSTGDGRGNALLSARSVAVDPGGNVYVSGEASNNAFWIARDGSVTQIIDGTGDGQGNTLAATNGIAVDPWGNVFVTGAGTWNAFRIDSPTAGM